MKAKNTLLVFFAFSFISAHAQISVAPEIGIATLSAVGYNQSIPFVGCSIQYSNRFIIPKFAIGGYFYNMSIYNNNEFENVEFTPEIYFDFTIDKSIIINNKYYMYPGVSILGTSLPLEELAFDNLLWQVAAILRIERQFNRMNLGLFIEPSLLLYHKNISYSIFAELPSVRGGISLSILL